MAAALPADTDGPDVRDREREIHLHLTLRQGERREAIDVHDREEHARRL